MVSDIQFDVVVVGSLNQDISVVTPRLPRPGETVLATGHFTGPGGKGANQAVAAARLGAFVAMVGLVGDDDPGASLLRTLTENGVDVAAVGSVEARTGLALITIDPDGENTIVGSSGANMLLAPTHIRAHRELIESAKVVVAQLEIPPDTVREAAKLTTGIFCLNPAPATTIPADLLEHVDVLIPNRSELGLLAGTGEPIGTDEVIAAIESLALAGSIAVTLGRDGALLAKNGAVTVFPALEVEAVDATGAGDAFCGALAFGLSRGQPLEEVVPFAVAAGGVSVTRFGATEAMPTFAEVEAMLGR